MQSGPVSPLLFMITPGILIIIGIAIWLVKSYTKNKGDNKLENRKAIISTFLFVIGGVPLLIYPGVLLVNLMSLAGEPTGKPIPLLLKFACYGFLAVSSSYPLTYFLSLAYYKKSRRIWVSLAPIFHLAVAVLLFLLWSQQD